MLENFCDYITPNIWIRSTTDSDPIDYYVEIPIEQKLQKTPYNTKDELNAKVAFTKKKKGTVGKVCRRFCCHLKAVVEANGDTGNKSNVLYFMIFNFGKYFW